MEMRKKFCNINDIAGTEAYINDMAQQGWHLAKIRGPRLYFEEGERGAYVYRLFKPLHTRRHESSVALLERAAGLGAEEVSGRSAVWVFRRPAEMGGFSLFASRADEMKYWNGQRTTSVLWLVMSVLWILQMIGYLNKSPEYQALEWCVLVLNAILFVLQGNILIRYILPQIRRLKERA